MKVCDKTCIFCFFPIVNKHLCMEKSSLLSERSSYLIVSRSFLLQVRNVSEKSCRENKTRTLCSITFLENSAVYEIMWKNIVEPDSS